MSGRFEKFHMSVSNFVLPGGKIVNPPKQLFRGGSL